MSPPSVAQRVLAASLALLVVSCSATRHSSTGPTGAQDLASYVLIVEEAPGGQVTHDWKPLKDFDLTRFQYNQSAMKAPRGIVRLNGPENLL
jgi:hypothetical protein